MLTITRMFFFFFFSSRRRHTRSLCDCSSDVCSSDLEGRMRLSDVGKVDTKHPHRGFDNLWYVIEGSASTGHSTGPNGAIERARLSEGALLALRTGRGVWHAEAIGADELDEGQADAE